MIEAEPMDLGDYNHLRGWEIPADENPLRQGYKVVYPDGYVSWSPKEVFEAAYHELISNDRSLRPVFPSDLRSITVAEDPDYNGAHRYQFQNSLGYNNGEAQNHNSFQEIQFVQKNLDGTMTPGIQSEQLLIALIDRHKKLNEKFASREGALAITKMEEALMWLEARVKERIERNVMGDLKK